MRSQQTFSLIQSAKEIRVALATDGNRIGGLLNEQQPLPVVEGEPTFDYCKHMQNLVLHLDSAVDRTVVAEDGHSNERIRVSRVLTERDGVVDLGYDQLVAARQGLEGLYPRGGFELAFLAGDTPRVPSQLLEQLEQTVKLLRRPAVEPRELRLKGFSVDFDEVASELESRVTELRTAIERLDAARKVAEGTLVVKQKAIRELRRTVLWVGRTTEGLFYLAGEDDLAKRIRSSTRRPQRSSEKAAAEAKAEEAGSEEPATDAEPEASAEPAPEES